MTDSERKSFTPAALTESRNAVIYFCQTAISTGLPILAMLILTRFLSKEDFGALALAQVYAVFASSVCSFGLTGVFERSYFEYRQDRRKLSALLFGIVVFLLINFAVLVGLSYLLADRIARSLGFEDPGGLILYAFGSQFFSTTGALCLLYFRNEGRALAYAGYMVVASILSFTGSLMLVIYAGAGVVGVAIAQFVGWLVVFLLVTVNIGRALRPALDWKVFTDALRLAYPLMPRVLLGTVSSQMDKFLLGQLANVSAVGIYSIAQRLAYMVFIFMTMLYNVYSPRVYTQMFALSSADDGSIGRYLTPFVYISILVALSLLLVGEEIVILVLPEEFLPAIGVMTVLCMHYGTLFFGKITGKQLMYAKRTGLVSLLSVVGVMISLAICFPLARIWGAVGVAWGTLLAGVLIGYLYYWPAQRYFHIRWEWPALSFIYGVLLVAGTGLMLMAESGVPYPVRAVIKVVMLATYIFLGNKLGIVTVDNLRRLARGVVR